MADLKMRQFIANLTTEFLSDEELLAMSDATEGVCDNGCNNLGLFMGIVVIALFSLFILEVPYIVITIRCVADEERALALGMQSFVFRIIGNVPGPIVFGVIFDLACIFFRYDLPCMRRGNCWVYDNYQLSWSILTMVLIGAFLNFVFSFLSWLTYPKQSVSEKEVNLTAIGLTNEVPQNETGTKEEITKMYGLIQCSGE